MLLRASVLSLGLGLGAGCAHPYLTWAPREPLAARRGRLEIVVEDHRSGDHASLGRAYGFGGTPREILVPEGESQERIRRLAAEAAVTAGIGLASSAAAPTARLLLSLDRLRCDGTGFIARAELEGSFALLAPDGSPRVAPQPWSLRGKGRGCDRAFAEALDRLLDELAARLVEGPLHDAAL